MAWTHFTTALSPGNIITRGQRNELFDALDERIKAAGQAGDGLHADMAAVYASDLITDRVKYTLMGSTVTQSMRDALMPVGLGTAAIYPRYARAATAATPYTSGNMRTDVAAALGITTTQLAALLSTSVSSAGAWNALREALRLLRYAVLTGFTGPFTRYSKTASGSPWATVAANCAAAAETSSGFGFMAWARAIRNSGGYSATASRSEATLTLPAISPFSSGYDIWAFAVVHTNGTTPPDDVAEIAVGGAGGSVVLDGSTPSVAKVSLGALSDTGALAVDANLDSYPDITPYDPGPTPTVTKEWVLDNFVLHAAPTFTHP